MVGGDLLNQTVSANYSSRGAGAFMGVWRVPRYRSPHDRGKHGRRGLRRCGPVGDLQSLSGG